MRLIDYYYTLRNINWAMFASSIVYGSPVRTRNSEHMLTKDCSQGVFFLRPLYTKYTISSFEVVAILVRSRLVGPRAVGTAFVTHTDRNELDQWTRATHTRTTLVMERKLRAKYRQKSSKNPCNPTGLPNRLQRLHDNSNSAIPC